MTKNQVERDTFEDNAIDIEILNIEENVLRIFEDIMQTQDPTIIIRCIEDYDGWHDPGFELEPDETGLADSAYAIGLLDGFAKATGSTRKEILIQHYQSLEETQFDRKKRMGL